MTNVSANMPATLEAGVLAKLEADAKSLIARSMTTLHLKQGARVFQQGDTAKNYLMVKEGSVRVSVMTEQGREIVLYRVEGGQTCVLTSACLLSGAQYDAEAVAESPTEAIILPKPAFDELMATSPKFRQFVFSSYGERLHSLIGLVQEITTKHVDRKLARYLVSEAADGVVTNTHQAIAVELNTAREVVTRLLRDFSERGWLKIARGQITLIDAKALATYAGAV